MKRCLAIGMCVVAALTAGALAADEKKATDLKLFEKGVTWKFDKVNGKGAWELATDGDKPIGVMNFEFGPAAEGKQQYVMATAATEVPEGATTVEMNVRMTIKQKVTIRFKDATGQTLQFKTSNGEGTGKWEAMKVPLTKKLEHWGGDNDGKIHFPIKAITISVPAPAGDTRTGKIEFADLGYVTK